MVTTTLTAAQVPTASATGPAAPKKEFISYIHNFRGLAIFFVLAGHLLMKWPDGSVSHRVFRVFWENGTVLFLFIAGFLFQFLSKKFEFKDYLWKKLQFVVFPYFVLSVPIIIYRMVTNDVPGYITTYHPDFLEWPAMQKLAWYVFTGAHMQQFWFIPMIVIYYLAAPLFLYIDKNPKWYWLLVPLIVASCLTLREPFNDIPRMSLHFLSVYLFGMFISRYRKEYLALASKYTWALVLITVALLGVDIYLYPEYNNALNLLHKMAFCGFFIFIFWKAENRIPKFVGDLAEISFGIYFVHYYVLLVLKAIYEKIYHHPIPGSILNWAIYMTLTMSISVGIIWVGKKMFPRHSKQLIGC